MHAKTTIHKSVFKLERNFKITQALINKGIHATRLWDQATKWPAAIRAAGTQCPSVNSSGYRRAVAIIDRFQSSTYRAGAQFYISCLIA